MCAKGKILSVSTPLTDAAADRHTRRCAIPFRLGEAFFSNEIILVCLISGLQSFINERMPKTSKVNPGRSRGSLYLTQVLLTADGCIKKSGVGGQALIARVEHAAGVCAFQLVTVFASRRSLVEVSQRRSERRLAASVRPDKSRSNQVRRNESVGRKAVMHQGHLPLPPIGGGAGPAPAIPVP